MNTLGNTVGSRIKMFDNLELQTVGSFNALFKECPIRGRDERDEVIIGSPAGNNCRVIVVGDDLIEHKMYSDMLYTMDREEFRLDERETELIEMNGVLLE